MICTKHCKSKDTIIQQFDRKQNEKKSYNKPFQKPFKSWHKVLKFPHGCKNIPC